MSENITYLAEIIEALKLLDGAGTLKEINSIMESRNKLPSIHTNENWKDNVRATIQRHCSQTKSYNGSKDIFYSVFGLGEGFWGLKSMCNSINSAEVNPIERRIVDSIVDDETINQTEKEMIVKARIGQGQFRDKLITKYNSCIITGIQNKSLLVASHIKPWRSSNNYERLSEENGLLLSPLFDKLFDLGFMTFNGQGKLILSKQLNTDINRISFEKDRIYISNPSAELRKNLEYHNDIIFKHGIIIFQLYLF